MLIPERQSRLQELLARRGMADLDTLAAELNVSQSTVRRDLEALEQRHLVQRTHGGAVWLGDRSSANRPYAFDQRMSFQLEAKQRIGRVAAQLVHDAQTVLLDGGTTTYYLAKELLGRGLQIVTNSLPIAELFLNDDNVELILTGGLMYPRSGVLLGPMAEGSLAGIHANQLILSVAGLHDSILFNQNQLLVAAEQRMMRQSQEIILLLDSTKFGQKALGQLCHHNEIDIVVCDTEPPPPYRQQIEAAGCRLIVA
jgi:DeoR/GlpR family transcriptional regulator of sugar metabolism